MSDLEGHLGCVFWGSQSIPCEQRACARCQCEIAVSKSNLRRARKLVAVCIPCLQVLYPGASPFNNPGLVAGEIYNDAGQALLAALAELERN
jgi:hypothetical protein